MEDRRNSKEQFIDELNKVVREWEIIFNSINDPTMIMNSESLITKANSAMLDFLGKPMDEVIGKPCFQVVHNAKMPIYICPTEIMKKTKKYQEVELYFPGKDMHVIVSAHPCLDEKGNIANTFHIIRDITPLKRSHEDLKSALEMLRISQKFSHSGSWDWDLVTGETKWSLGYYELFGLDPQKVKASYENWIKCIYADDRESVDSIVRESIDKNKEYNTQYRIDHPRFGIRWVNGIGNFTYDEKGKPVRMAGICVDITEFKDMEQNIRLSENRFRELFDNMSSGVAVYEAKDDGNDFIFKDFNKAGERIELVKKEDIIGKSVLEVFPGVKEFGLFDVFKRVWKTGNPERHPISLYKDSRIIGWKENYIYKLPSGDIVAIYDDITERKELENAISEKKELYSAIFEGIPEGVFIMKDKFLECNSQACRLMGCDRKDIIGHSPVEFSPLAQPDGRSSQDMAKEYIDAALGGRPQRFYWKHKKKDGSLIDTEISLSSIRIHNDNLVLAIMSDITERKKVG
jgi:PAS domain S-box-containing protein